VPHASSEITSRIQKGGALLGNITERLNLLEREITDLRPAAVPPKRAKKAAKKAGKKSAGELL